MKKIIVMCSGKGSNLKYLIDHEKKFIIEMVIVDKLCGAIDIAKFYNKKLKVLNFKSKNIDRLLSKIFGKNVDLIVLAGFLPILSQKITKQYAGKIINTHPSLLPKYGGKGMYGLKIQEKVLENNDKIAGCTIHFVTKEIDDGPIILQKKIDITGKNLTPQDLAREIHLLENRALLEVIEDLV